MSSMYQSTLRISLFTVVLVWSSIGLFACLHVQLHRSPQTTASPRSACTTSYTTAKLVFYSTLNLSKTFDAAATSSNNVWSAYADGTTLISLSQASANASLDTINPALSPDGTKIVFESYMALSGVQDSAPGTSSKNIWIINADGTELTSLTQANTNAGLDSQNASFSPDGTQVVFQSKMALSGTQDSAPGTSSFNIWKTSVSGTGLTSLTQANANASLDSVRPSFSPSGSKVLFESMMALSGTQDAAPGTSSYNIWTINTDGTSLASLTQANANANLDSTGAKYSPSGDKVVFQSKMALSGVQDAAPGTSSLNIWIMGPDGSGLVSLTQANTNASLDSQNPAFSPDGTTVVFQSLMAISGIQDSAPGSSSANIWKISRDGTSLTGLTQASTNANLDSRSPYYSADGSSIFFSSKMDLSGTQDTGGTASYNIWKMTGTGTSKTAMTQNTIAGLDSSIYQASPLYQTTQCR